MKTLILYCLSPLKVSCLVFFYSLELMLLIGVFILYIRVVSDWLTKFLAFAV